MTPQLVPLHLEGSAVVRADRVSATARVMRETINALDDVLASLEREPAEGSSCPEAVGRVSAHLAACRPAVADAGLALLGRVIARALSLSDRLRTGQCQWDLMAKLALEELVTVIDMVLDVVDLVGVDSGCRHEERVSFRILAAVAPQVLVDVDHMDFREIRFHQAAAGARALRAG